MEKKNQMFSTKSVYGSCAVTSIIVIALWAITHNWIVLIAALIAVPYLVTRLFHKEVNKRAKVPIVIMIILAILLSFMFLRFKDEEPAPVEQPTVIVDEQTDDEQTQDETDSAEQQGPPPRQLPPGGGDVDWPARPRQIHRHPRSGAERLNAGEKARNRHGLGIHRTGN